MVAAGTEADMEAAGTETGMASGIETTADAARDALAQLAVDGVVQPRSRGGPAAACAGRDAGYAGASSSADHAQPPCGHPGTSADAHPCWLKLLAASFPQAAACTPHEPSCERFRAKVCPTCDANGIFVPHDRVGLVPLDRVQQLVNRAEDSPWSTSDSGLQFCSFAMHGRVYSVFTTEAPEWIERLPAFVTLPDGTAVVHLKREGDTLALPAERGPNSARTDPVESRIMARCVRLYDGSHFTSDAMHTREKAVLYGAGAKPLPRLDDSVVVPSHVAALLGLTNLPLYDKHQRNAFLRRFESVSGLGVVPQPTLSIGRTLRASHGSELGPEVHGYANFWQDISLYTHLFSNPSPVRDGFYIEIGAQDGLGSSNTLFFEQHLNWTGILIEPSACGRCILPHLRPRDRIINAGACRTPSRIAAPNLTDVRGRGFCHPPRDACVPRGFSADCMPMRKLLKPLPPRVDLFSIDVETNMMEVLETIPWNDMQIDVLIVEATGRHANYRVVQYLHARGYSFLWSRFGGDVVAVRSECVAPKPKALALHGAWWKKFLL